jgi:hypothetical protein
MNHCAILNVYFISNGDGIHISSYNGVKPNTAVVAHHYLSYNGGIVGDKTILSKLWVNSMNWFNEGHRFYTN